MKILWTDGSAVPNPGPGGFAVLERVGDKVVPVVLGRDKQTTNIQMEGKAIIAAIKYAGGEECEIHTDSEFWINVLSKWAVMWEAKGWKKKSGPIKNLDMVKEMWGLYSKYPVSLYWVKGHVGIEYNELADEWANRAREGATIDKI